MVSRKIMTVSLIFAMAATFFSVGVYSVAAVSAAQLTPEKSQDVTGKSPQAVFPDKRFEFEAVMEGHKITHDFIIENHGNAPLVIKNVRPD